MLHLLFCLILLCPPLLEAHTVPNLQLESSFGADQSYTLSINFDPRLFLSEKPTELPPVVANWWLEQTEPQRAETLRCAAGYLHRAVTLLLSEKALTAPEYSIEAVDGATNEPIHAQTTEVHLIAKLKGRLPAEAQDFQVQLHPAANAALVLLNHCGEKTERRPQILFTGETSRAFAVKE
jgi:hypothetical protein